jgi:hypothetical protein
MIYIFSILYTLSCERGEGRRGEERKKEKKETSHMVV